MNFNTSLKECQPAQNEDQKSRAENRKVSGDSFMKTSENTPKSERLNIIKINISDMENQPHSKSEEVKQKSNLMQNLFVPRDKSSPRNENGVTKIDWLSRLQEQKNLMATTSPAPPIAALLKRESSAGENLFDLQNTPNRFELGNQAVTFGFCKSHFNQTNFAQYISDDESLPDNILEKEKVRDFSVNQFVNEDMSDVESEEEKPLNPFVECCESEDFSFNDNIDQEAPADLVVSSSTPEKVSKPKKSNKTNKRKKILIAVED